MEKYVFFIGGTGARVFRAFLHLCASGVICSQEPVQTVILDVDGQNGDIAETVTLYNSYQWNYEQIHAQEVQRVLNILSESRRNRWGAFRPFASEVRLLDHGTVHFLDAIRGTLSKINLKNVVNPVGNNERVLEWFYTKNEREQELDDGFFAHPNIGSIFFRALGSHFDTLTKQVCASIRRDQDVSVTIVGSMFGGTGAAGIPSILRFLEESCAKEKLTPGQRKLLHINAVLVTPYFKLRPPVGSNIPVNSDTFYGNTRSALEFYGMRYRNRFERMYMAGQNTLEYVSDKYADKGSKQHNKPHVVELIAALAVKDSWILRENVDRGEIQEMILRSKGKEPMFGWSTLDDELSGMADMLRTQFLIKTDISPCANDKFNGNGKTWYSSFRMGNEGSKVKLLTQYTDAFLDWMYHIQRRYDDADNGQMIHDERITLAGSPLADLLSDDPAKQEKARKDFSHLIDIGHDFTQAQTVSYKKNMPKKIMLDFAMLSGREKELAKLGTIGLFIRLFQFVSEKA